MKIIFHSNEELNTNMVINLLPGQYSSEAYGSSKEKIAVLEDYYIYVESSIEMEIGYTYSHFGINEINKDSWFKIIRNLEILQSQLIRNEHLELKNNNIKLKFNFIDELPTDMRMNLIEFIKDLNKWFNEKIKQYNYLSIIGL